MTDSNETSDFENLLDEEATAITEEFETSGLPEVVIVREVTEVLSRLVAMGVQGTTPTPRQCGRMAAALHVLASGLGWTWYDPDLTLAENEARRVADAAR